MNTEINPIQFDASEVKCNGISHSFISESNRSIIQTYISTYRQTTDFSEIVENLEADGWNYYYGSRCKDDSTIAVRITSGLTEYAKNQWNNPELAEMWINAQIENISAKNMNILIHEALRDCSSADHWYMFEKEWN